MFASIASFLAFSASSIAFFAAGFATGVGFTLFTSVVPLALACSTPAFAVALSIACFAASAFAFASAFAAVFSSAVKSLFASIASFLAFSASSITFLAAGLACAVGFTEFTLVAPSVLACSTPLLSHYRSLVLLCLLLLSHLLSLQFFLHLLSHYSRRSLLLFL